MGKTFEQGKDEVAKLCQYFATNQQSFLAPGVKEAHVRQSLIDPLFEALGWDVRNVSMAAPQYREVITEDSLDFDQYAASKRKRGTSEVDSEFLKDIEGWRDVLARNLAKIGRASCRERV